MAAPLPTTTRGSTVTQLAPDEEAIGKAMECAKKSPIAADYLVDSFARKMNDLGKFMVNSSKSMMKKLQEFRDFVHLQFESNGSSWSGIAEQTEFKNYYNNAAAKLAAELMKVAQSAINIDFAIKNNTSELVRSFHSAGKALASETNSLIDKLLNAFFAESNLVTKGSVVYEATDNGEIKQGPDGPGKADPDQVRALLTEGLGDFIKEKEALEVKVNSRPYPGTVEARVPAAEKPAQKKADKISAPETPTVEEPKGPTTPSV